MIYDSWQWWVAQGFAFVGLVLVVISMQQKTSKGILWYRNFATASVTVGVCFLGEISAIIMCGAGMIRNAVSLVFAYKPNTSRFWRWGTSGILIALLISLNIVFWTGYLNIISMVLGISLVITFMQKKPSTIRALSVGMEIISIVYYSLLLSPINVGIEVFGLISAIVGIVRLDIKRKVKENMPNDVIVRMPMGEIGRAHV